MRAPVRSVSTVVKADLSASLHIRSVHVQTGEGNPDFFFACLELDSTVRILAQILHSAGPLKFILLLSMNVTDLHASLHDSHQRAFCYGCPLATTVIYI